MSEHYYHKPLIIAYSGGKDSEVLADLAIRSGANIEFINNHTTVDAPETVYHVRAQFQKWREMGYECTVNYPMYKGKRTSMWETILRHGFMPSPWIRYCCQILKEGGTNKRFAATGVRAAESTKRKIRTEFEWQTAKSKDAVRKTFADTAEVYQEDLDDSPYGECRFIKAAKRNRTLLANPLIDWTDKDIWEYIKAAGIKYNPLYDEGWTRVGCIGCPLAQRKTRDKEFARWPKYEKLYRRSCNKLFERSAAKGTPFWLGKEHIPAQNGDDIFEAWMNVRK